MLLVLFSALMAKSLFVFILMLNIHYSIHWLIHDDANSLANKGDFSESMALFPID